VQPHPGDGYRRFNRALGFVHFKLQEKFFGPLWQGVKQGGNACLQKILFASRQVFGFQPITRIVSRETILGGDKFS
jgi:hypothetical protein